MRGHFQHHAAYLKPSHLSHTTRTQSSQRQTFLQQLWSRAAGIKRLDAVLSKERSLPDSEPWAQKSGLEIQERDHIASTQLEKTVVSSTAWEGHAYLCWGERGHKGPQGPPSQPRCSGRAPDSCTRTSTSLRGPQKRLLQLYQQLEASCPATSKYSFELYLPLFIHCNRIFKFCINDSWWLFLPILVEMMFMGSLKQKSAALFFPPLLNRACVQSLTKSMWCIQVK